MRLWLLRFLLYLNDLLHTSQAYRCSPLCTILCLLKRPSWLNDLLHTSQKKRCPPLCMCSCFFRLLWSLNDSLEMSQKCGCSAPCAGLFSVVWQERNNYEIHLKKTQLSQQDNRLITSTHNNLFILDPYTGSQFALWCMVCCQCCNSQNIIL